MHPTNKVYSSGYFYEFNMDLSSENIGVTHTRKLIGEKRTLNNLSSFLEESILSIDHDQIHRLNDGLFIVSTEEEKIIVISSFCEHLKSNEVLKELVLMCAVMGPNYNEKDVKNRLKKDYLNYCLHKELETNNLLANKKIKI